MKTSKLTREIRQFLGMNESISLSLEAMPAFNDEASGSRKKFYMLNDDIPHESGE